MKKKILVTGGAGFIGSHLVDKLIEIGHRVVVLDNLSTGRRENLNPKARFYEDDIGSPGVAGIFQKEKPEVVFHLAAQIDVRKSIEDPLGDARTNILGSLNILQNFISVNQRSNQRKSAFPKKLIFTSSGGAIYGETEIIPTPESHPERPVSPYGIGKLAVEKYLYFYQKAYGLNYTALRLANVYGPRQNSRGGAGVMAVFCRAILEDKEPVIYGDGRQTRDFVFVEDVVEAAVLAMSQTPLNNYAPVFNIGTGIETSVNEVLKSLAKETKKEVKPRYAMAKKGEQKRSCLDYSKAKKELGWRPRHSLEEGLRETIKWFSNH